MRSCEKLISVIIPVFNIDEYLSRCLDSVLNQTYKNLEIIIINDGSNDNTKEVIKKYASLDKRIHPIHKKNEGVSATRNTGLDNASGEYIGFVDGDDIIEIDMYESLMKNILLDGVDIAHCGYKMIYPSKVVEYFGTKKKVEQNNYEALRALLLGYPIEPGLGNKLYKRNLFNNLRLNPRLKHNEDLLMNFYLFSKAKKSVFFDETKYHYILRKNSAATAKFNFNKLKDPMIVWEEILGNLSKQPELLGIAYNRYISVLCKNGLIHPSYLDQESLNIQKDCIRILKKNKKKILKEKAISFKSKILAISLISQPKTTRSLKDIYDVISGNKNKYKVE